MAVLIAVAIVVVVALERDAGITHLNMFAVGRSLAALGHNSLLLLLRRRRR